MMRVFSSTTQRAEAKTDAQVAEDPLSAVAEGTGRVLEETGVPAGLVHDGIGTTEGEEQTRCPCRLISDEKRSRRFYPTPAWPPL